MKENGLFVDNPLELTELFGAGVFLVPEPEDRAFDYKGAGNLKILNMVYYDEREIPAKAMDVLARLMSAVKVGGKGLTPSDYAVINAAGVLAEDRVAEIVQDFQPQKLIIWSDEWFSPQPAPLFYTDSQLNEAALLRCHSLQTVISDEERKRECWASIKRFFGF